MKNIKRKSERASVADIYGVNVFGLKNMRNYLSEKAYDKRS
jgi:hypothetical protein